MHLASCGSSSWRRRRWRSFHATQEGERGSGSAVVHGGASMAASAIAGESEGEEGSVSCMRGEGPGGSGVSKCVRSEWGGSRRWKQEVASPPVRAPRRRPFGKGRRRLTPGSGGLAICYSSRPQITQVVSLSFISVFLFSAVVFDLVKILNHLVKS